MRSREQILNELLTVKYATVNNFYSPSAKSRKGARFGTYKIFRSLEQKELIRPIQYNEMGHKKINERFFYVTAKGAKEIGRHDEYTGHKEPKSLANAKHESSKIDVALAFVRNYPKYELEFNYKAKLNGLMPDILIRMIDPGTHKQFTFMVEIERKKSPFKVYEKVVRYEKNIHNIDYKKENIDKNLKVLVIINNLRFDPYLRPVEYQEVHALQNLELLKKQFEHFMEMAKGLPEYRYRFTTFNHFHEIGDAVWFTPLGSRVKLLNT